MIKMINFEEKLGRAQRALNPWHFLWILSKGRTPAPAVVICQRLGQRRQQCNISNIFSGLHPNKRCFHSQDKNNRRRVLSWVWIRRLGRSWYHKTCSIVDLSSFGVWNSVWRLNFLGWWRGCLTTLHLENITCNKDNLKWGQLHWKPGHQKFNNSNI